MHANVKVLKFVGRSSVAEETGIEVVSEEFEKELLSGRRD